jgi:glycosyltransferase involved in cell wall biosynthesis
MHLIGLGVSRRTNIPWIADFRDPWTKIDFYEELMLTRWADRKHHRQELSVLQNARFVTVNSHDMKRRFDEMGMENIRVIPNGFDPDDFDDRDESGEPEANDLDENFSLTHIGTIVPSRNPETLWKVLSDLVLNHPDFSKHLEIKLIGSCDFSVYKSIRETQLEKWVKFIDYLPHKEAIRSLKKSQVLLLFLNNTAFAKGVQPGKLFEYMCADRPILTVGPPEGETAYFLNETRTGHIVDFDDAEGIKKQILEYYNLYREGKLYTNPLNLNRYSRKTLAGEMAELLNQTQALQ